MNQPEKSSPFLRARPITHSDDRLEIETPESVAFAYKVAGIGSRFLAAAIDTALIALLQVFVNLTCLLVYLAAGEGASDAAPELIYWTVGIALFLAFAVAWGYYIFFELIWNGQSPGKRVVGLRVIRGDGMPISFAESAIRNLVRAVDFLPISYAVGIVAMFADAKSRRLGDLAAGTLVVWDQPARPLAPLIAPPTLAEMRPRPPRNLPVERLTAGEVEIAEDFLRRRSSLANRAELARHLATNLAKRLELPPESITDAEALLEEIVGAAHR